MVYVESTLFFILDLLLLFTFILIYSMFVLVGGRLLSNKTMSRLPRSQGYRTSWFRNIKSVRDLMYQDKQADKIFTYDRVNGNRRDSAGLYQIFLLFQTEGSLFIQTLRPFIASLLIQDPWNKKLWIEGN